jgi:DKNYY family
MAKLFLAPGWPWFVSDQRLFFGMQEVRRADIPTFQPLNEWWGRDANRVYCAGSEMRGTDLKTFHVLNSLYAMDAHNAYTIKGPIREADASTFSTVGPTEHAFNTTNGYAKDARFVYHTIVGSKASVIKGADASSFKSRGRGYGSDESTVYFERKKMSSADPEKWHHIRGPHSRSEKNAYVLGQRIRGANGNCLESLPILDISEYWCRDDKGYYRWDQLGDPEAYLREFRQCFIFLGRVSNLSLTWNPTESLDSTRSDSWAIAKHAWIMVDCKEWIQKPDLDIAEVPRLREPFKFGAGLHLDLLAPVSWREEDRIWIFKPVQDHQRVERRLVLSSTMTWWEYSSLDQLDSIKKTIAVAASA